MFGRGSASFRHSSQAARELLAEFLAGDADNDDEGITVVCLPPPGVDQAVAIAEAVNAMLGKTGANVPDALLGLMTVAATGAVRVDRGGKMSMPVERFVELARSAYARASESLEDGDPDN